MGEARPWQIAVIVVGLIVMVGGVLYQCSGGSVAFADSIVLVDVASGELVEAPFPKGQSVMFPATNPDTKSGTLYPAELKDGKWFVQGRYVPYVSKQPEPKAMNARSGLVNTTSEKPVRKNVFEGT